MSGAVEKETDDGNERAISLVENSHDADLDQKAAFADYKADAIEAENAEHSMTVMQAVRAYPMASFWAFVMSFTIVSRRSTCLLGFINLHLPSVNNLG